MELTDTLRAFGTSEVASTHYEDCWRFHPGCAMHYAADTIDALTAENARLREGLERVAKKSCRSSALWDDYADALSVHPNWGGLPCAACIAKQFIASLPPSQPEPPALAKVCMIPGCGCDGEAHR